MSTSKSKRRGALSHGPLSEGPLKGLNRRGFLRGLGVAMALPSLERFFPASALAAESAAAATTASGAPLRMGFLYVPNGVNLEHWRPVGQGTAFQFNSTMQPLTPFKDHLQVFTGFEHKNGTSGSDGGGDHARANATILTGARPKKTSGADIYLGTSVDQIAAQHVGGRTRYASLELSCDGARTAGACDSGYSCAYQYNLSWRSPTQPMTPETNPRLVFERLFGAGKGEERLRNLENRIERQQSILDFVQEDAKQLHRQLGRNDRRKLDEYFTGVREIEQRLDRTQELGLPAEPNMDTPEGIPGAYRDHIRLMLDLLVLAYQSDSTRIGTFLLAHDGSNRSFNDLGIAEGHHYLSHHGKKPDRLEKLAKIDQFYVEQLAYFLDRMQQTREADGSTLLDNSMLVYCSGLSDPDRHKHDDLPVIVAGRGGGALSPGRHVNVGATPMSNLYVAMLNRFGVPVDSFGDSTAALSNV